MCHDVLKEFDYLLVRLGNNIIVLNRNDEVWEARLYVLFLGSGPWAGQNQNSAKVPQSSPEF